MQGFFADSNLNSHLGGGFFGGRLKLHCGKVRFLIRPPAAFCHFLISEFWGASHDAESSNDGAGWSIDPSLPLTLVLNLFNNIADLVKCKSCIELDA